MRHLRVIIVAVLVFALTATVALGATKSVGVKKSGTKFKFSVATLRVKTGDTVKWSWSGNVPHNVSGKGVKSKTGTNVTYSHKFSKAGTYPVVCTIHQAAGQKMKVIVS
jgi:plastocyanin